MRSQIISAMIRKLEGQIEYHKVNIEVYMQHPVGIGEHPDIMEAVESELVKLAEADEKLSTLTKYFNRTEDFLITEDLIS